MSDRPVERLMRFTERQSTPAWGASYRPAIRSTPQEAPKISRPTILRRSQLGRDIHLLSQSEVHAALLALHNPNLLDLHEQRVLSPTPTNHPLQASPYALGLRFPTLPGTVRVAESLGVLSKHPKIFHRFADGQQTWVPIPYLGDLLLFLADANGPYCVNWNIKRSAGDYLRPRPRPFGRVARNSFDPNAELRHLIEEAHYQPGLIRTLRVTGDAIDPQLAANLRELYGWHDRGHSASRGQQSDVLGTVTASVGTDTPTYLIVRKAAASTGLSEYDVAVVVYQAIWRRQLRVDLFTPLLMSRPLRIPQTDPLQRYAAWFER